MASRLSEESTNSIYDLGHRAILLRDEEVKSSTSLRSVDLSELLEQKNSRELIQSLKPSELYRALMALGTGNGLEVLELLSSEQVTGILDFDAWKESRLMPKQALSWIRLFGEIGPQQMYERFSALEEEYQLAILGPYIRIFDQEEYENMSDAQQDTLITLPSADLHYEINTDDAEVRLVVENIIESAMAHNMTYALSLLAHAAYVPPTEQEALLAQFRNARIEEEGYVSFEESQSSFRPLDLVMKMSLWPNDSKNTPGVIESYRQQEFGENYLDRVFHYANTAQLSVPGGSAWSAEEQRRLTQGFAMLANNLCAASQVETDDIQGLDILLRHARALSGLGLEVLSQSDLPMASKIILHEAPKELFRVGLSVIRKVQESVLDALERVGLGSVDFTRSNVRLGKAGLVLATIDEEWIETLGFLPAEILKGLFNRYPVRPVISNSGQEASNKIMNAGAQDIVFAPIGSVKDLDDLVGFLDGFVGLLESLRPEIFSSAGVSLDRSLATACFNYLVDNNFVASPVNSEAVNKYLALDSDVLQQKADALTELCHTASSNHIQSVRVEVLKFAKLLTDTSSNSRTEWIVSALLNLHRTRIESIRTGEDLVSGLLVMQTEKNN